MMKSLTELEAQLHKDRFERLRGEAGRWNIGDSIGGALVTHVQPPFAFTAQLDFVHYEGKQSAYSSRLNKRD